jgi:hypothetical protein
MRAGFGNSVNVFDAEFILEKFDYGQLGAAVHAVDCGAE